MSDRHEAIADIIAEMRNRDNLDGGEMCDNFSLDAAFGEYGGYDALMLLKAYADRIEAALKREAATAKESLAVGNAAKLREVLSAALEQVNKVYDILSRPCVVIEEARQGCREARGVLIPALAAPARNCDRFTNLHEAWLEWQAYCSEHMNDAATKKFHVWLYATAEGGAK